MQVRGAVVPGQLRLAVLSLEQCGQLAEEGVVGRLAENGREAAADQSQRRLEVLFRLVAVVGQHELLPADELGEAERAGTERRRLWARALGIAILESGAAELAEP
jgi:hypothetical protein